jgi:hypothetical protein
MEETYFQKYYFGYCHVYGFGVTNSNGFWIWGLGLLVLLTFTVNCNSSHIELLLNDVCLTNLREESLTAWMVESESYVTTDGQPTSLSWNKAPIWSLRPDLYYCLTVAGLLILDALSDERTGLSFTIAAGPRQGSHFQVRVPYDSWPYFTVSDSRLPFSSPPTTRRTTVEVFDPASTRVWIECQSQSHIASDGQSVSQ